MGPAPAHTPGKVGMGMFGSTMAGYRNCPRNEGQGRAFVAIKPSRVCTVGADKEALITWMNLEVTRLRVSQTQQNTDVPFHVGRARPNLIQT